MVKKSKTKLPLYWSLVGGILIAISVNADSQAAMLKCLSADVLSVTLEPRRATEFERDPAERILVNEDGTGDLSSDAKKAVTVVVTGPMLGEIDSKDILTSLACTKTGIALTASISRSKTYDEKTFLENYESSHMGTLIVWQPSVKMSLMIHKSITEISAMWEIGVNGAMLDHARTYGMPEQHFPVELHKLISSEVQP